MYSKHGSHVESQAKGANERGFMTLSYIIINIITSTVKKSEWVLDISFDAALSGQLIVEEVRVV